MDDPPVRRVRLGRGDERPLPAPAGAGPDGPLGRFRPPHAARIRLGRSTRGRRGRAHRRCDRLDRRHGDAPRRDPARRGLHVDDDQRSCLAAAAPLRARRGGAGCRRRPPARHRAERRAQGVRRPRQLHLPAATLDAAHHRPVRLLRGAHPGLEHDLGLRVPHPRGRIDGGAGDRLHARQRHRLLRGGRGRRSLARRIRRAALVLLQRAQPLLPGGREVPRRTAALGADHARPLRRDEPARSGAPLPRADGWLDAHRAAAGGERRPRRGAGARSRLRWRPVPAHERLRRGARAADPSTQPPSHCARSRC